MEGISCSVKQGRQHRELPCILGAMQAITQAFGRLAPHAIPASIFCFFKKKMIWVCLSQIGHEGKRWPLHVKHAHCKGEQSRECVPCPWGCWCSGLSLSFPLQFTQEHCKGDMYIVPVTNEHKACAVEAADTVVALLIKQVCASVNIWWVMMEGMHTRRGFPEAEEQSVCAVWDPQHSQKELGFWYVLELQFSWLICYWKVLQKMKWRHFISR